MWGTFPCEIDDPPISVPVNAFTRILMGASGWRGLGGVGFKVLGVPEAHFF